MQANILKELQSCVFAKQTYKCIEALDIVQKEYLQIGQHLYSDIFVILLPNYSKQQQTMSKVIYHSRFRTDHQLCSSTLTPSRSNPSVLGLSTTANSSSIQSRSPITMRQKYHSCYQQPHILTITWPNPAKTTKTSKINANQFSQGRKSIDKKYVFQKTIAKSSTGLVFKAHSSTHHHLAIKKILLNNTRVNKQLIVLKKLDHPNLLKLIDHYFTIEHTHQYLHLVTRYYPCTLKTFSQHSLSCLQLMPLYLYQILQGLKYLKHKGIIHSDLTPKNILLETKGHKVIIGGFGSSIMVTQQRNQLSDGLPCAYRAPQLVFGSKQYSFPIDMWAFGCIAIELVTGKPLFYTQSSIEHMIKIVKFLGTPSQRQMIQMNPEFSLKELQLLPKMRKKALKDSINSSEVLFVDLMSKILVYSPSKRMTPQQALHHSYFDCLRRGQFFQKNNLNASDFGIVSDQQEQILISPSSIKLQLNHRRFRTISKKSESTVCKNSGLRDEPVFTQMGSAKRLFD